MTGVQPSSEACSHTAVLEGGSSCGSGSAASLQPADITLEVGASAAVSTTWAIVVRQPWLSMILGKEKTSEIRRAWTKVGWTFLAEQGTGLVVGGMVPGQI